MSLFLAVILFHNDQEIVNEQIEHMINNKHDIIIFNHNSNDKTQELIEMASEKYKEIIKVYELGSDISFATGQIFRVISSILIKEYKDKYDWITFIESDEFLEGPKRDKSYYEYLLDVSKTNATYIQFNNILYWFTESDDINIKRVRDRIKYYSWFYNCGPRIYAWKAKYTNPTPFFNHNTPILAIKYPTHFNTCHYPFTSKDKYIQKLKTRKSATSGGCNCHYKKLYDERDKILKLEMEKYLFYDDGSELKVTKNYDWKKIIY